MPTRVDWYDINDKRLYILAIGLNDIQIMTVDREEKGRVAGGIDQAEPISTQQYVEQ